MIQWNLIFQEDDSLSASIERTVCPRMIAFHSKNAILDLREEDNLSVVDWSQCVLY